MRLKELSILSYGKFFQKKISFEENFNIIYGPNESGKSTIRSFILEIFFGFINPGASRIIYSKEYKKYQPWSNPSYEGGLLLEYKGEDYYFYRNFLKGSEKLTIHNTTTGENAKELFKVDTSKKVESISEEFFGLRETSIRDIFVVTDDFIMENNLTFDIKSRIINQYTTNSETMSVEDIIKRIRESTNGRDVRREIRTIREQIKAIELKEFSKRNLMEYDVLLKDIELLNRNINELEEELKFLSKDLEESFNFEEDTDINDNVILELSEARLKTEIRQLEGELTLTSKIFNFKSKYFIFFSIIALILGLFLKKNYLLRAGGIFATVFAFFHYRDVNLEKKRKRLSQLYGQLDSIYFKEDRNSAIADFQILYRSVEDKRKEINELRLKREKYLERARFLERDIDDMKKLKENKKVLEFRMEELNFNREMGDLSISIIEKLSKNSFRDASGLLVEDSSEFIKEISGGKYNKLFISDEGELKLFDSEIQQIIDLESLSQGALSQVYLAYRLGLIVNSGVNFPIIVDDGLTLYDNFRQGAAMKLLRRISQDYQVIFFTNRKELIEGVGYYKDINVIKLGA